MQRQLEQAIQYANERQQFGQSIGKFQSVSGVLYTGTSDIQRAVISRLLGLG